MSARGTGLLVIVLAALVAYLWLVEAPQRAGRGQPTSATEPPPLLTAAPSGVSRVEIEQGKSKLVAVRRDGGWVDASGRPWQSPGVADLLDTLTTLRPVMVVDPDPSEPADYGLGPDATRLRLAGADGRSILGLEVGERNPAWTGLYARVAGHKDVVLVGAVLRWELEKLRETAPADKP